MSRFSPPPRHLLRRLIQTPDSDASFPGSTWEDSWRLFFLRERGRASQSHTKAKPGHEGGASAHAGAEPWHGAGESGGVSRGPGRGRCSQCRTPDPGDW